MGSIGVIRHAVEPFQIPGSDVFPLFLGQVGVWLAVLDHEAGGGNVSPGEEHEAIGGSTVTSRAACLLVVGLHALGHIVVHHEGDVGLVDAHAKGVGGHHDRFAIVEEILLVLLTVGIAHARVVGGGIEARLTECLADLLHPRSCRAVDDTAFSLSFVEEGGEGDRLFLGAGALDAEPEVGAVKARGEGEGILQLQKPHDVTADAVGGCGGEGTYGGAVGEFTDESGNMEVARAEVLSPLGYTVSLVHGDEGDGQISAKLHEGGDVQPLGGDVDQLVGAIGHVIANTVVLGGGE